MTETIRPKPSTRGGTSQRDRDLPGLSPDHVRIDETTIADRMVFAAEFAKWLRFTTLTGGEIPGGWRNFFASDVSSLLAGVASQDVDGWRTGVRERISWLRDDDHHADVAGLRRRAGELFGGAAALAKAMDAFLQRLPDDQTLKASLRQRIQSRTGPALRRLVGYHRAALDSQVLAVPLAPDPSRRWVVLGQEVTDARALLSPSGSLSGTWWGAFGGYGDVPPDDDVFLVPGGAAPSDANAGECLVHASNHFLFTSAFDTFTESYARLVDDAAAAMLATLETKDDHAPQYALFLAFLRLRESVQDRINGLQWRHLDHYYKDILRIRPKAPEPDHVHLLAELSKSTTSAALPEGTRFKAGKDSLGRELLYTLDRETTFNTGKVAQLLALHADRPPFAGPVSVNTAPSPLPAVRAGFAVASHYLFLAEGERSIVLRFGGTSFATIPASRLRCYLTHAKGWLEKTPYAVRSGAFTGGGVCTEVEIRLGGTDPSIVAWSAKVHKGAFDASTPVLQCLLLPGQAQPGGDWDALKGVLVDAVEVAVRVGADPSGASYDQTGAKAVVASNQGGSLDVSKPFHAWSAVPTTRSAFLVGHSEAFTKPHAKINLHIAWADRPASYASSPTAKLQFLDGGVWKPATDLPSAFTACASDTQRMFSQAVSVPVGAVRDWREPYGPHGATSRDGFLRILLDADFGQGGYQTALLTHLEKLAKKEESQPPALPYSPRVAAMHLSYSATTQRVAISPADAAAHEARSVRLYQVGPFGEAEQAWPLPAGTGRYLLPQFRFTEGTGTGNHLGAWMIGLSDLAPGQGVDLLVSIREGSADPLVAKPEEHVTWSYWARDRWVPFAERDVSDATRQLLQTGIVRLSIPLDATTDQGIMPHGHLWVMASVTQALPAVGTVLSVHAQAMRATLADTDVAPDHLDTPLPAGTISKLLVPDARFRKFAQPQASFGGRRTEIGERFHRRTSERLRHKARAVTMWDYETMVLEAFPSLYKAKCLPHTRIVDDASTGESICCENAQGHVALVVVPSIPVGVEFEELLRPYVRQEVLTGIRDHLADRVTGQVVSGQGATRRSNVHVCNPVFEEIQIDFMFKLRPGHDDFSWYQQQLRLEIARYLAPWATMGAGDDRASAPGIQFGGRIPKSSLIRFVEDRPYVDHITSVVMRQRVGGTLGGDIEEAVASTPRSVLTSAPPSQHLIGWIP